MVADQFGTSLSDGATDGVKNCEGEICVNVFDPLATLDPWSSSIARCHATTPSTPATTIRKQIKTSMPCRRENCATGVLSWRSSSVSNDPSKDAKSSHDEGGKATELCMAMVLSQSNVQSLTSL